MSKPKMISLEVQGMTCSSCAQGVENKIKESGAENVVVNFALNEASFTVNDDSKLDKIIQKLNATGYPSKVASSQENKEQGLSALDVKLIISLCLAIPLMGHMFVGHDSILNDPRLQLILTIPVYIVGIIHFGVSGFKSLRAGSPNMDVLVMIGSSSAFFYSIWGSFISESSKGHEFLFFETTATIIALVLLGNWFEERAIKKTTSSIQSLNKLQVKTAKRLDVDSQIEIIDITEIKVGDHLIINTGDLIPVDAEVISGQANVDESSLTGESIPVQKTRNSNVSSGTILADGHLMVKCTRRVDESSLQKIIEMVKLAQSKKPEIQKLGDKVSAIFIPVVLGIGALTFCLNYLVFNIALEPSIMRSIAVLVISCPCAMGLATPTAVMVGVGKAASQGILIKGGDTLEKLAKTKNMVFDKTGTLTTGKFEIQIHETKNESLFKEIAGSLAAQSSHPISQSISSTFKEHSLEFSEFSEIKGKGLTGRDQEGNTYALGSNRIIESNLDEAFMYVMKNGEIIGKFTIEDKTKEGASAMIQYVHSLGIKSYIMSGDITSKVKKLSTTLGISKYNARLLPEQKLEEIKELQKSGYTAMVGDGINDAPSLTQAEVGISFADASEVSIQSAEVVILGQDLKKIEELLIASNSTYRTIKQNLFWAFFYNVAAIPLAAMGYLDPMIAALAMAMSDVVVIGNSLRLKYKS